MTRFTPLWLQAGSYAASVDRRLVGALWPTPASSGCAVTAAGAMDIAVAAGSVAVPLVGGVGSVLCVSDNVETVTLDPAPAAGLNRIDLVICQARGADIDGGLNNDFVFDNVTGDPAATPVAPAVPANAVALASVYLVGGSAAVDPARITDTRPGNLPVSGGAADGRPPVTTGALQSYTDSSGEVWVAKPGVYGGAWKRARDVLHARWTRVASYTSTVGTTAISFDTKVNDPYGIYASGANAMVAPIAGLYRLTAQDCFIPTAATHMAGIRIYGGATMVAINQTYTNTSLGGIGGQATVMWPTAAGTNFLAYQYATVAGLASGGPPWTFFEMSYLGTG